jgi:hypothetical protein
MKPCDGNGKKRRGKGGVCVLIEKETTKTIPHTISVVSSMIECEKREDKRVDLECYVSECGERYEEQYENKVAALILSALRVYGDANGKVFGPLLISTQSQRFHMDGSYSNPGLSAKELEIIGEATTRLFKNPNAIWVLRDFEDRMLVAARERGIVEKRHLTKTDAKSR